MQEEEIFPLHVPTGIVLGRSYLATLPAAKADIGFFSFLLKAST